MRLIPSPIADVIVIEPLVFEDERGFFLESWQKGKWAETGLDLTFVQDSHSQSVRGVLRGLHYQIGQPQGKLVRVVRGTVFDVAVDLRHSSSSFGSWVGFTLSEDNRHELWIPPGFAHGFYVTSDAADVLYKSTDYYAPRLERTILWDDPDLAIDWPLAEGIPPSLSVKDLAGQPFREADCYE